MAKILVVEDNPATIKLSTFLLEKAGHSVLSAMDPEAGLALARAEQPDLILMDIQLPGMDGLEEPPHCSSRIPPHVPFR